MAIRIFACGFLLVFPLLAGAQTPAPPAVVQDKCALCHGEAGETASEDFPRLSGQHEAYLLRQLLDFRSGRRRGLMMRMVRGLSEDELGAIARYFAAQAVPPPASLPTEKASAGRTLHEKGKPQNGMPACRTCHGEAAHGSPQLPRLAGQNARYLERQLTSFTQRTRTNDNAVMHEVAEQLTPEEARAVAEYLASLP